jgi:tRNA pseudouridine32 synthase/23S rRNA pseudouridine746 synthase
VLPLTIHFQNEHFVVVQKPAGWLSVPSRDKNDPRPCVGLVLQKHLKIELFPCHRLDFEVSGLLLFAKSAKAHRAANQWFEKHQIIKIYNALSEGVSAAAEKFKTKQLIKSTLVRGKKRTFAAPHGQPAETYVHLIDQRKLNHFPVLFWQLEPLTGRSHQLRYELSHLQFPILGDQLYGSHFSVGENKISLQAVELNFEKALGYIDFALPPKISIPFDNPEIITKVST